MEPLRAQILRTKISIKFSHFFHYFFLLSIKHIHISKKITRPSLWYQDLGISRIRDLQWPKVFLNILKTIWILSNIIKANTFFYHIQQFDPFKCRYVTKYGIPRDRILENWNSIWYYVNIKQKNFVNQNRGYVVKNSILFNIVSMKLS